MNNYLIFNNKNILKSEYLNEDIYNLLDMTFEIPENFSFDIIKVESKYIARPDLLSYDLYGTDMYVDILCKLNGISNPFELNEDDLIIIPSASDIEYFITKSKISEKETDKNNIITPKAKQKNEKRKPNDAIIGDKRFTIDTKKRVIIY